MRRLILVRHAMPEVIPGIAPSEWSLSSASAEAAASLRLASASGILSSPERKARETVALATGTGYSDVATDRRFREVDRVEAVHDGFRDARRAWVSGALDERHVGWETPDAAARRFHEGLLAHSVEDLVVGTHGMVLTAWLVAQGLVPSGDPAVAFWEALRFPDVLELSIPDVTDRGRRHAQADPVAWATRREHP